MKKSKYFAAAILLVLLVGVIGVIAVNKNKAAIPSQPPVSTEQTDGKTPAGGNSSNKPSTAAKAGGGGRNAADDGADEQAQRYKRAKAEYEAAKAEYEASKEEVDAAALSYNEAVARYEQMETLMPYLRQYTEFCDGDTANLPGFDSPQSWFTAVVRPMMANLGIAAPADVTDFPAFMEGEMAAAKREISDYEAKLAKVEENEKRMQESKKVLDSLQAP